MSLVTTTRSQRSRIALQSISTRVVLPEPTGPPTPTRSGGRRRWRPGMACSGVMVRGRVRSGAEQARVLDLVARGEDREHRREGLHRRAIERERRFHRGGNPFTEAGEHALAGALPERHRLERGLHHGLGPAGGEGEGDRAYRRAGGDPGEREGDGPARGG